MVYLPRPWDLCQRYASDFLELLNAQDAESELWPEGWGKNVFLRMLIAYPIGSMYGIYANIWGILMVNVKKIQWISMV